MPEYAKENESIAKENEKNKQEFLKSTKHNEQCDIDIPKWDEQVKLREEQQERQKANAEEWVTYNKAKLDHPKKMQLYYNTIEQNTAKQRLHDALMTDYLYGKAEYGYLLKEYDKKKVKYDKDLAIFTEKKDAHKKQQSEYEAKLQSYKVKKESWDKEKNDYLQQAKEAANYKPISNGQPLGCLPAIQTQMLIDNILSGKVRKKTLNLLSNTSVEKVKANPYIFTKKANFTKENNKEKIEKEIGTHIERMRKAMLKREEAKNTRSARFAVVGNKASKSNGPGFY